MDATFYKWANQTTSATASLGNCMTSGPTITLSAHMLQGPYPKEEKTNFKEHYHAVKIRMLNMFSPSRMAVFNAAEKELKSDLVSFCLQRVEQALMTLQRAVPHTQRCMNAEFLNVVGCKPERRGKPLASTLH
jgi:hypothetical protein